MPRLCPLPLFAVALSCLLAAPSAAEEGEIETTQLTLRQMTAPDAMVLLRTIMGTRQIAPLGDRTLEVQDSPERLALVEAVLEMADPAEGTPHVLVVFEVGDGTVIATLPLQHVPVATAMRALRSEIDIARISALVEPPVLFVRDTEEQVTVAIELLETLDQPQPD